MTTLHWQSRDIITMNSKVAFPPRVTLKHHHKHTVASWSGKLLSSFASNSGQQIHLITHKTIKTQIIRKIMRKINTSLSPYSIVKQIHTFPLSLHSSYSVTTGKRIKFEATVSWYPSHVNAVTHVAPRPKRGFFS